MNHAAVQRIEILSEGRKHVEAISKGESRVHPLGWLTAAPEFAAWRKDAGWAPAMAARKE